MFPLFINLFIPSVSRYIPVHEIAQSIGNARALALPAFHAFTGCDVTASFFGRGKKAAWSVWMSFPEMNVPLMLISQPNPSMQMISPHIPTIHCFVNRLYGVDDDKLSSVDGARLFILLHRGKDFENMPPSSDALYQKILRVTYQVYDTLTRFKVW